jgi:hypothetical protein
LTNLYGAVLQGQSKDEKFGHVGKRGRIFGTVGSAAGRVFFEGKGGAEFFQGVNF